ncbi:hypothetical protein K9M42_03140 [Patescibacteria group bacterium]|nr:hypothetical protein [Patescibacteria group bacterium]
MKINKIENEEIKIEEKKIENFDNYKHITESNDELSLEEKVIEKFEELDRRLRNLESRL